MKGGYNDVLYVKNIVCLIYQSEYLNTIRISLYTYHHQQSIELIGETPVLYKSLVINVFFKILPLP